MGLREYFVLVDQYGSNGDFTRQFGLSGLSQGQLHEVFIIVNRNHAERKI